MFINGGGLIQYCGNAPMEAAGAASSRRFGKVSVPLCRFWLCNKKPRQKACTTRQCAGLLEELSQGRLLTVAPPSDVRREQ